MQVSKDGKRPSITVFPSHVLSTIDRKIYSGFTEHMGRCIYGGLYDPTNPDPSLLTPEGFRKDVIDSLRQLQIPVFRYPGGNFCATYHWFDGVGPRESRPARPELAWQSIEPNTFGTDEFMAWCRHVDAEPYLCLNFGTGTLDEALAWLEYCNGTKDTYYANLRRRHGQTEPYNVKYWALGNEMWGDWQMCQMTAEAYAEKAYQWAKALKLLDPSIVLVLCGKEGATTWDFTVLKHCLRPAGVSDLGEQRHRLIDMHSIHLYTASRSSHEENVFAPLAAEHAVQVATALIDLTFIENKCFSLSSSSSTAVVQAKPKICFDEWNVWCPHRAPGSTGAEEKYTLSDALAVGIWLNVLVRQSGAVEMANIAQSVNVISPLMTTQTGVIKQTTWFVYELFCRFMRGKQVAVHVDGVEGYMGPTTPGWLSEVVGSGRSQGSLSSTTTKALSWLDVSACLDVDDDVRHDDDDDNDKATTTTYGGTWLNLAVVNAHPEHDITVDMNLFDPLHSFVSVPIPVLNGRVDDDHLSSSSSPPQPPPPKYLVQVHTVTGRHVDVTNMDGKQEVFTRVSEWEHTLSSNSTSSGDEGGSGGDNERMYTFPKHSFTLLRWKALV